MENISKKHKKLIASAGRVRKNAHAPYSKFKVGAAVLASGGKVFTGCNLENSSYGLTVCAERNAVAAMAASGVKKIEAVAVVSDCTPPASPCGACRQVIAEFSPGAQILMADLKGNVMMETLDRLLPGRFQI